jgi:hypothetical protein
MVLRIVLAVTIAVFRRGDYSSSDAPATNAEMVEAAARYSQVPA